MNLFISHLKIKSISYPTRRTLRRTRKMKMRKMKMKIRKMRKMRMRKTRKLVFDYVERNNSVV